MATIAAALNSARYVSDRRKVVVRKSLVSAVTDGVAGAADGVQQRRRKVLVDLRAKPRDMNVDDVGLRIEVIVPYVLEQHGAGHHLARMLHEIFQQAKLARLQHNRFAGARHLVRETVEHEIADHEARASLLRRGAPGERLDAGEQLAEGIRLGEIVVAAGAQALDPVVDLAKRA